jgi:hypothetical protein
MKRLLPFGAWLLAACATPPASPSAIEPALGHHQPQPPTSNDADADADAEPPTRASEAIVGESSLLPTAEEEALCQHIVKLVQSESQDRASAEQTDELLVSCALALAHDRRRMGTEEFERRAACMSAATAVVDFAACAPESAP